MFTFTHEVVKFSVDIFTKYSDADFQKHFPALYKKPHNYLAISGGGANGAYGAGLLYGWSETGDRPEFSMVTGISTGALSAPFAFLGSDYDEKLKEVCQRGFQEKIVKSKWKFYVKMRKSKGLMCRYKKRLKHIS